MIKICAIITLAVNEFGIEEELILLVSVLSFLAVML